VNLLTLEKLRSVPSGYRQLVALDRLHDIRTGGDVEFLYADALLGAREEFGDGLDQSGPLQPFAQTGDGNRWSWSESTSGENSVPEIWLHEIYRVSRHAPTFETFLYRSALEDAGGCWGIEAQELPSILLGHAEILADLEAPALAEDLQALSRRPILDQAIEEVRRHGIQQIGVISEVEARDRIRKFLGEVYLEGDYHFSLRSSEKP
jgi:hypothetical protein